MKKSKKASNTNHVLPDKMVIGFLGSKLLSPMQINILTGIKKEADKHGMSIFHFGGPYGGDASDVILQSAFIYQLLDTQHIHGVIGWSSQLSYNGKYFFELEEFLDKHNNFPSVFIGKPIKEYPTVMIDNSQGINKLMEHLIHYHGYRKIAFISGPEYHPYTSERFEAYVKMLSLNNIPFNPKLVTPHYTFAPKYGKDAICYFLDEQKLKPKVDIEAIVSTSDMFAFTALKELEERKVLVPQDIAVVGFNNRYESIFSKPTITTIDINEEGMGKLSMELMISMLKGEKKTGIFNTPTQLVIRHSCGCMRRIDDRRIIIHKDSSIGDNGSKYNFNEIWHKQKKHIVLALNKKNKHEIGIDQKWNKDLLNGIFDSYIRKSPDYFLSKLENIFSEFGEDEINLNIWQNYLLTIKDVIFKIIIDYDFNNWVKMLFDNSNLFLLQRVEKNMAYSKMKMVNFESQAISLYQSIVTTYELPKLLELLLSRLPDFGIESCYFSLFKDPGISIEYAILKMVHNSKNTLRLFDNTSYYKSKMIIPSEYYNSLDQLLYIILPLYFKEKPLGFILLGMSTMSYFYGIIYEVIRGLISSSLQRATDLHYLQKTQFLLEKKAKEANDANMAKTQFLRNISHEIRTPLNCIIGFTETIKSESDIKKIHQHAATIENESNKLLELINQLLDFSKIESGKLEIHTTRFNLYDTLQTINDAFRQHCAIKNLEYSSNISNNVPTYVISDALRLRQVLVNLIGNAVKFTNDGSVSVNVSIYKETASELFLHFTITDTGIGIPKENIKAIFDPFVQVESSNTRTFGGSGLGTAISKQLVTLIGGEIGVESRLNQGSTFWFTFKCSKCTQEKEQIVTRKIETLSDEQKCILEQSSILVADDYPTNCQCAMFHLKKLKCTIDFAENGKIAVDMFKKHKYDLILMDIQMPELDGLQATQIIRKLPGGDKIPVIAMTAIAYEDNVQMFKDNDMDDCITKPFNKIKMQEIVSYWLINKKNRL